jgi:tripartite-type tricarboxylate transporter receptor subunit TctC
MVAHLLAAVFATVAIVQAAVAAYPEKPVRIVVAYAPGGAVDVVARKLAQKLTEQTGQSFYVENKPGATGLIGTQAVVRSAPDGYNLLAIDNTYSILPYVFKKLPWDHDKALIPITPIMFTPVLVVVPAKSQFKTLAEFVAYAKANPDKLAFGSGGNGSTLHFAGEALQQAAGIKMTHVPYKGGGEAILGLVSGQVDVVVPSTGSAVSQIKSGKLRALAVSGEKRLATLPDVPTFAEAGLPGFGGSNWAGLAAPAGTPKDVTARLYAEVKKALETKDMKDFITSLSAEAGGLNPDAFARLIKEETARWAKVAEKAGIERQ